jgi:hypothetical protein
VLVSPLKQAYLASEDVPLQVTEEVEEKRHKYKPHRNYQRKLIVQKGCWLEKVWVI